MHYPEGGSRLYLLSHKTNGIPLEPVAGALERLQKPYSAAKLEGESAPLLPYFVSPGTYAKAEAEALAKEQKKKTQQKVGGGKRNTVGYLWTLVGPHRRPNARMPIEEHAEAGRLLKSVLVVSSYRKGVCNRVDAVRSELDEWVQREYGRDELPDEVFFGLYYHEEPSKWSRSLPVDERVKHVESLARVKALLVKRYPGCAPLRAMLKRLDLAIASMNSWAT